MVTKDIFRKVKSFEIAISREAMNSTTKFVGIFQNIKQDLRGQRQLEDRGGRNKANPIRTKKQNRAFFFHPLLGSPNDHLSSSFEEETKATRLSRRN